MGGKFGPSNKVIDGYDSVGDAYTGDFNGLELVGDNDVGPASYSSGIR